MEHLSYAENTCKSWKNQFRPRLDARLLGKPTGFSHGPTEALPKLFWFRKSNQQSNRAITLGMDMTFHRVVLS